MHGAVTQRRPERTETLPVPALRPRAVATPSALPRKTLLLSSLMDDGTGSDCARGDSWYASRRGRAGPAHPRSQLSSPLQSRTVPRALAGRGLAPERKGPRSGRGPETLPVGRSTPTPMATPGPRRGFWPWFPEVLTRPSGAQPSSGCRRGASLSPHGSSGQRGSVGPRAPRAAGTSPQCLGGLAGDSLC